MPLSEPDATTIALALSAGRALARSVKANPKAKRVIVALATWALPAIEDGLATLKRLEAEDAERGTS